MIIIDPFNYFFESNFIENKTKSISAARSNKVMPRGTLFWKMNAFDRNPDSNVIIGDSRGVHIDTAMVRDITGEKYFNFAVPGANMETNISLFWHATKTIKLKSVYWQLGFSNFSENEHSPNLVEMISPFRENVIKYFFKSWFWADAFYTFYYYLLPGKKAELTPADETRISLRDKNWPEIIKRQGEWKFKNYSYPDNIFDDMEAISEYCETNGIDLNFIIFPSHPAYFQLIDTFQLTDERNQFKEEIYSLGKTYDFGFENKFTMDSTLFFDLYHVKQSVTDSITVDIFTIQDPEEIHEKYLIAGGNPEF
jgi:hypothetical protein